MCKNLAAAVEQGVRVNTEEDKVRALYLGPFALPDDTDKTKRQVTEAMEKGFGQDVQWIEVLPPHVDEDKGTHSNFWFRPRGNAPDTRRRKFRTQILTSVVALMSLVMRYRPRIIVGIEQ